MSLIKLKTSDNRVFKIDERIARMSTKISSLITDSSQTEPIHLNSVHSTTFRLIHTWAKKHIDEPAEEVFQLHPGRHKELPSWDEEFLAKLEDKELFPLMNAAVELDIEGLKAVSVQFFVNWAITKTPGEVHDRLCPDHRIAEEAKVKICEKCDDGGESGDNNK